jgi:hypothetical protein
MGISNGVAALNKVSVDFTLHSYDSDPDAERVGLQAAQKRHWVSNHLRY